MGRRRVQLPEAEIRDSHLALHERARPVRRGGGAPALGDVNGARNGANAVAAGVVIGGSPFGELEEEEGAAPPPLLALLDLLGGFVFGDGLLQLEMEVYGS